MELLAMTDDVNNNDQNSKPLDLIDEVEKTPLLKDDQGNNIVDDAGKSIQDPTVKVALLSVFNNKNIQSKENGLLPGIPPLLSYKTVDISLSSLMGHPSGFSADGASKLLDFGMRRQNTGSAYSKVVNLANQALVQELMSDPEFFDKFQLKQIRGNEECFEITARHKDEQGAIDIAAV
jgi:hypothetical protein